jgi:excisionase family DNA binding protein
MTPGAPWRIVLTKDVRRKLSRGDAPEGWLSVTQAARRFGLSKSHIVYLIKTDRIQAKRVIFRRQGCWRINPDSIDTGLQPEMFHQDADKAAKP